ncbi:FdhF/YdeP family oxidoreductase [Vibrio sp.]|nr:FdhF/YdeP family oxidoreductase [Vibrio sp.]
MDNPTPKKRIQLYRNAAGGWGALASTAKHLVKSENIALNIKSLLKTNQDFGFDCPGCAWGESKEPSRFKFCENGAKAVNWESTKRNVDDAFFSQYTVSTLKHQDGYFLESQGRLSHPMSYNPKTDKYEPISWEDAYRCIADALTALDDPNQAEFYTSGRASNEAAFLYQLFVRLYGTNNLPDCSNMCHEASGFALTQSIGIGKGTVTLHDFEYADAIFLFGQNPGTNHPRMLDTLSQASRRGADIVSINTLKERGLQRFQNPQRKREMLTQSDTAITGLYLTPNLGGDMALVRGMVKSMLETERNEHVSLFDYDFIHEHTEGLEAYLNEVDATSWDEIIAQSGIDKVQIQQAAEVHRRANNVICTWAMGITQHKHSVAMIQEITNLQLLTGQLGKQGAGLCPVRGHSNVQGDRTMGINEKPQSAFLDKLGSVVGFVPPREHGHNVIQAIKAMLAGQSKVFIGLGGNFVEATPDTRVTEQALSQCDLTVHISTKLNRSHLIVGKQALILPCLGRTDKDIQESGEQRITVEDSFSMVHASGGVHTVDPKRNLKSEPAIIAGIAKAVLSRSTFSKSIQPKMTSENTSTRGNLDWDAFIADYANIRDVISQVIPGFEQFNEKIRHPGGFYLGNSAAQRVWNTTTKKAHIQSHSLPTDVGKHSDPTLLTLQTLRSHDQFNTTIYGMDDRYRGVYGQRRVIFMSQKDIIALGLNPLDIVTLQSIWKGETREVQGFTVVEYDIPIGNAAAYFPETNPLIPLDSYGDYSWTPTSKSIAIRVVKDQSDQILSMIQHQ